MENRALSETINTYYERYRKSGDWSYFDTIGFLNVGYWKGIDDSSIEVAQINLMEEVASFFRNKNGNVLDVACGQGASSKFLRKYFSAQNITGINVSKRQLEVCKVIAPECDFKLMDATNLEFSDASFDNMLCIEAAFHFLTRYKFFEEACRVLRTGGRLAMLDVLYNYDALTELDSETASTVPRENYLPDLDAYRESLLKAGFSYVRVEECAALTGKPACAYVVGRLERQLGQGEDPRVRETIRSTVLHYNACSHWCMVYAVK